jgi:hypothetical protein
MLVVKSLMMGLVGLIVTPIVVFFLVLTLAHIFDSSCGTPGDSGGCEMGSAGIAIASAIPGAIALFLAALIRGLWKRKAGSEPPPAS